MEDVPDVQKLNNIGIRVNYSIQQVQDFWYRINKMSNNLEKVTYLYGRYLMEIVNNEDKGRDIIQKLIQRQKSNLYNLHTITNIEDIKNDQNATFVISTDDDNMGIVQGMNSSACSMFGFQKFDLMNKNVKMIMPQPYACHHDDVMRIVNSNNKYGNQKVREKKFFGLQKTGYVFPIHIILSPLQTIEQNNLYIGQIRVEKQFRRQCQILIDENGFVRNLSSQCIQMLKLDIYILEKNKFKIQFEDLFPGAISDFQSEFFTQGDSYQYTPFYRGSSRSSRMIKDNSFNLYIKELIMQVLNDEIKGYIVNIEFDQKIQTQQEKMMKIKQHETIYQQQQNAMNMSKQYQFEFLISSKYQISGSYKNIQLANNNEQVKQKKSQKNLDITPSNNNVENRLFIKQNSEIQENSDSQEEDSQELPQKQVQNQKIVEQSYEDYDQNQNGSQLQQEESSYGQEFEESSSEEVINNQSVYDDQGRRVYGQNYRTVRYFQGGFQDVSNDQQNTEEYEENMKMASQSGSKKAVEALDESDTHDFGSLENLQKYVNIMINDQRDTNLVKQIKYGILGMFLFLFSLILTDFFIAKKLFSQNQDEIQLVYLACKRIGETQKIIGAVQDIIVVQRGLYDPFFENIVTDKPEYILELKENMQQATQEILDIQNVIGETPVSDFKGLDDLLQRQNTQIYYKDIGGDGNGDGIIKNHGVEVYQKKLSLNESIGKLLSVSRILLNVKLEDFNENNWNIYFINSNIFSNFTLDLVECINQYGEMIVNLIENQNFFYVMVLIISIVFMIVFVTMTIPFLIQIKRQSDPILLLFLDIPEHTIQYLFNRCDKFIISIQIGDTDEVENFEEGNQEYQNNQIESQQSSNNITSNNKKKRRKYKYKRSSTGIFVLILVIGIIMESYFIYNFISSKYLTDDFKEIMYFLNVTGLSVPYYHMMDNVIRNYALFPLDFKPFNQNAEIFIENGINTCYEQEKLFQDLQFKNSQHLDKFNNVYQEIMYGDACKIIVEYKGMTSYDQCANEPLNSGRGIEGMRIVYTHYFENLREQFMLMKQLKAQYDSGAISEEDFKIKCASILITLSAAANRTIQTDYFYQTYDKMVKQLNEDIQQVLQDIINIRTILVICFISLFLLLFIMVWIPYVNYINRNTQKSRNLISMIPISVIKELKQANIIIRKFMINYSRSQKLKM